MTLCCLNPYHMGTHDNKNNNNNKRERERALSILPFTPLSPLPRYNTMLALQDVPLQQEIGNAGGGGKGHRMLDNK